MTDINLLIHNEVNTLLRRAIVDPLKIQQTLMQHPTLTPHASTIEAYLSNLHFEHKNYSLMCKILRSELIQSQLDCSQIDVIILDPLTNNPDKISKTALTSLFDRTVNITRKIILCQFVYNPYKRQALYYQDNDWFYNTYLPPVWMHDHFYDPESNPLPEVTVLPELYKRFFMHLTAEVPVSYNYLLDWMANGLHTRNYCILTTIGKQGIGKGLLGEIMSNLFGRSNYHEGKASRILSGKFNSQILNKRLVYIDEIKIENQQQEDEIKSMVNNLVEVELKGVDAIQSENFANFYISSNKLDALKITGDDRRFSVLDLTETRLELVIPEQDIEAMLKPENIKELALYLWNRGKTLDKVAMKMVLKSNRLLEVKDDSLADWEEWLLHDYAVDNQNKDLVFSDVCSAIEKHVGFSYRPGRPAMQSLEKRFPELIQIRTKVNADNFKKYWVVRFPSVDKKSANK